MNCQNELVWQLGSVHKIHIHLEATSPLCIIYIIWKDYCENIDLASIATLPTEVGDGLKEQDTYSP